ncbi:hypothetical protein JCM16163A_45040 [Paenibacillus sp. YK5]
MRIDNQVVVIRPEWLRPEYRTAVNQLVLALSGFGTFAYSRGRAVYVLNLYTGEEARWNREDFMGSDKTGAYARMGARKTGAASDWN